MVAARAIHRCEYCHAPESIFTLRFEVDHIVPISEGGTDAPDNLALACRACNLWKSNAVTALDEVTEASVRLFNPRSDLWRDHFRIDIAESVTIVGITAVGRATVRQLRMNSPAQLEARRWWIQINLFP